MAGFKPVVLRGLKKKAMKKKKQIPSTTLSDLPADLIGEILSRVDFIDLARSKSVAPLWSSAAESISPVNRQAPWLLLPPDCGDSSRFFNPADGRLHATKSLPEEVGSAFWVGSSHGYLIGLTAEKGIGNLFLFNPLTGSEIPLPRLDGVIDKSEGIATGDEPITTALIRSKIAYKAIVTSDLASVVVIQGPDNRRISICSLSGDSQWRKLDGGSEFYHDVSSVDGKIYALGDDCQIEVWNSDGSRVTKFEQPSADFRELFATPEGCPTWRDAGRMRYYLVGPDLLIGRVVGDTVDDDGNVLMGEEPGCFYRTVGFEVYRMVDGAGKKKKWVKAESLGENRAVFLGEGHSVAVPATGGVAADCIYYNDDYWEMMDLDYMFGGHDIGVFSLRDGKIVKEFDGELLTGEYSKIEPPPSWIVPNP